jgi:hypothetical protein
VRSLPAREQALLEEVFASLGWLDVLGIHAGDVSGHLLHVDIAVTRRERLHPRTLHRLACVAAHLTSALRLRLAGPPAADAPPTEAVLEPSGVVRHAVRGATRRSVPTRRWRCGRGSSKLGVRSREGLVDLFAPHSGGRSPERKHM